MGGIVVGFLIVVVFVIWLVWLYAKQRDLERREREWFESDGDYPWPDDLSAHG